MTRTTPRPQVGFLADVDAPNAPTNGAAAQPPLPGLERDLETAVIDGVSMEHVKAFLVRWRDLEAKIADLRADQRDLAEAMKAQGIPTRTATLAFRQLKQRRTIDSTLGVFEACQMLFGPLLEDPA